VKRTRSLSTEASSSQEKIGWKPIAEAPLKGTSMSRVKPEPTHAGSEEDEDSEIPLCPRSHRTKGSAVVSVRELLEKK